jgi:hypothetical protein
MLFGFRSFNNASRAKCSKMSTFVDELCILYGNDNVNYFEKMIL